MNDTEMYQKNAYTTFITTKKNVVGDKSGNTIVQKRLQKRAPSIAAASIIAARNSL